MTVGAWRPDRAPAAPNANGKGRHVSPFDFPVERSEVEPTSTPRFRLLDDSEVAAARGDQAFILNDVLPANALIQLFGAQASYKTFLALSWALAVSLGMEWAGRITQQGAVVYVYAEGRTGLAPRLAALKSFHRVEATGILFLPHRITVNEPLDCRDLVAAIKARLGSIQVGLIVLDTLNRNFVGNENSSEDMSAFVRGVDILRERTGASVLVVHHSGHAEADRSRGSSVLDAASDTVIGVARDDARITLTCRKQKDAPEFAAIELEAVSEPPSLVLKPIGQGDGQLSGNRLELLRVVQEESSSRGIASKSWQEASGIKARSSFHHARKWLRARGYVRDENGKWKITDAGRLALLSNVSNGGPTGVQHPGSQSVQHEGGICNTPSLDKDVQTGLTFAGEG